MIQTVVKRDGRIVGFNARKIGDAVRKAMVHTEAGENEELIHLICEHVANRGKVQMTVEEILAGMKKIFADPSCGEVFRIKGFLKKWN